ncbi:His Kinase A (phospho-acceptor) domain-containing protein [Cnuella takakiae]|uniref:histidine kinase n=1 Tax=Cnuella takakiae TaxID=1302690 RepID=A0A1M4Y0K5_9BACT|nr:ATP-binding protein [Cnuella takakiae]OLY93004.1 hypothetical protein BUE76_14710 [Cnuella takakiae]SHE99199.1 His Kinase A (phospho-acceptor) domain-containing protein [Cnuella takakiae]
MSKKTLILLGTSFLLFMVAAIIRFISFTELRAYIREVECSRELIVSLEKLSTHLKSAQIYAGDTTNGAMYNFFVNNRNEIRLIPQDLEKIGKIVKDHRPKQQKQWEMVGATVKEQLPLLQQYNLSKLANMPGTGGLGALLRINTSIAYMVQQEEAELQGKRQHLIAAQEWNDGVSLALVLIALLIFGITFTHNLRLSRKERWLEGFLSSVLDTSRAGIVSYKAIRQQNTIEKFSVAYRNDAAGPLIEAIDLSDNEIDQRFEQFVKEAKLFRHFVAVVENDQNQEMEIAYQAGEKQIWLQLLLAKRDDGVTLSMHDISAIKQYQEDLKTSITELERSNSELEQYAYAASHDLQEPLRKITTFAHMLQDTQSENLNEKGRQYIQKIIASTSRMTTLIRDLLNFSSLKQKDHFENLDLNDVLESVLQDLELAIQQKEVRISAEHLPEIEAIPLQMHQLFYNLLTNAVKFASPNRKPEIRITCGTLPHEQKERFGLNPQLSYLQLMVADNGIGFDRQHANQIFGLFKRLNNKELYTGSGIGLALCKRVMDNHQGLIFAESEEGMGARFYLLLPTSQHQNLAPLASLKKSA